MDDSSTGDRDRDRPTTGPPPPDHELLDRESRDRDRDRGDLDSPSSAPPEPLELEALAATWITTLEDRVRASDGVRRKGDRIDSLEAECQHKDDRIAELERRLTECDPDDGNRSRR